MREEWGGKYPHRCYICENFRIVKIKDFDKPGFYFYKSGCKKKKDHVYSIHTLSLRQYENCEYYLFNKKLGEGAFIFFKSLRKRLPISSKSLIDGEIEKIFNECYEIAENYKYKSWIVCPHCGHREYK
jgi:hypothetical protein